MSRTRPPLEDLLDELLEELLETGGVSAASARVETADGRVLAEAARGAEPGDLFDLASLTKPFVATLALVLDQQGLLPLDRTLGEVIAEVAPGGLAVAPALEDRRLGDLLAHRAGLIPWAPLYRLALGPEQITAGLLSGRLPLPAGAGPEEILVLGAPSPTYSDLGYVLWSRLAEVALGEDLDRLLVAHLLTPLGLSPGEITSRPEDAAVLGARFPACRLDRGVEERLAAGLGIALDLPAEAPTLVGKPQDGNARFLTDAGIALPGHAGLFGHAAGVARLGREWLAADGLLAAETKARARAWSAAAGHGGGAGAGPDAPRRRGLVWEEATASGSAGEALTAHGAFGHLGFTGTSLWLDPEQGLVLVLLAHRTDSAFDLNPWRRRFHDLALRPDRSTAP